MPAWKRSPRGPNAPGDGPAHRPGERDRDRGRRPVQRRERGGADAAVPGETGEALVPPDGTGRAAAVDAVERSRWKAVLGEQELERRDVPALDALPQQPAAEPVPAEAPERPAGVRPDDAVGCEPVAALEPEDRALGRGAAEPVDRALVDAALVERDLERGHARVAHRPRRGGGEQRDEQRRRDGRRPDPHAAGSAPAPGLLPLGRLVGEHAELPSPGRSPRRESGPGACAASPQRGCAPSAC